MDAALHSGNLLLAALPLNERRALQPHLHEVSLSLGQELFQPGERVHWSYFLESGLISMVSEQPGRKSIEVGMIGREGIVGPELLLGAEMAVYRTFVQTGGDGFRIKAALLQGAVRELSCAEADPAPVCPRPDDTDSRIAHRLLPLHPGAASGALDPDGA